MRRFFVATAAVLAAVVAFALATMPPLPQRASGLEDAGLRQRTIPGSLHIHTVRSDGWGEKPQIAAAGARAGLRFIVLTDHGDATRQPDPPAYISGVLCIDAVEISTNGGHYIALDMPAAPYPLGGEAAAVVEDVRRLGGFGVVAHPLSAKPALSWRDWGTGFDAIEWLNADAEWRNESTTRLVRTAFAYLLRPSAALASIFDRPDAVLERVDRLSPIPPVVLLAGHDAHGGVARRPDERASFSIAGIPSYESSFGSFALRVVTERPLSGVAETDSRLILDAIERGHVFTAIDAIAAPALLDFHATTSNGIAAMGDTHLYEPGASVVARALMPPRGRLVLIHDGVEIAEAEGGELTAAGRGPGKYRIEARVPGAPGEPPVPWLVSNPLYLVATLEKGSVAPDDVSTGGFRLAAEWHVEKDPLSTAAVTRAKDAVQFEYALGGGGPRSQFAAAVMPLTSIPEFDRVVMNARTSSPMRTSIQFRFASGERWVKSVYLGPDAQRASARLEDFRAAEGEGSARPDFRTARDLLFVVDLTNARPGSSGVLAISGVQLVKGGR